MMKKNLATLALTMLATSLAGSALAADPGATTAMELKASLQQRFPNVRIESVRPSPELPGLYEIVTGTEIIYADGAGNYVISGHLMDTRTRADLTAGRWDDLHAIDFSSLPLDHAIKTVHGNGARRLALFADPDCPYCQQLEQELKDLDNVTIYTFLFPLPNLHPDAYNKAVKIWCSANQQQTWSTWMLERKPIGDASCQQQVIDQNIELGHKLDVVETPTLFLASGRRIAGTLPRVELEAKLAQ